MRLLSLLSTTNQRRLLLSIKMLNNYLHFPPSIPPRSSGWHGTAPSTIFFSFSFCLLIWIKNLQALKHNKHIMLIYNKILQQFQNVMMNMHKKAYSLPQIQKLNPLLHFIIASSDPFLVLIIADHLLINNTYLIFSHHFSISFFSFLHAPNLGLFYILCLHTEKNIIAILKSTRWHISKPAGISQIQ